MSQDLEGLLARVEAATGADEELDALIMCALVANPGAYVERSNINGKWCIYYAPNRIWSMSSREGTWRKEGWPLTASLDAALALCARVLPGWRPSVAREHAGHWSAFLIEDGEPSRPIASIRCVRTDLPTPALALLAAMLSALAQQDATS